MLMLTATTACWTHAHMLTYLPAEYMAEARRVFRDPVATEFVIVTIPTAMAAAESIRLAKALRREEVGGAVGHGLSTSAAPQLRLTPTTAPLPLPCRCRCARWW